MNPVPRHRQSVDPHVAHIVQGFKFQTFSPFPSQTFTSALSSSEEKRKKAKSKPSASQPQVHFSHVHTFTLRLRS